jgi:hypothetical protein
LEEESHFEESSDDNEIPEFVKEFLDTNLFEVNIYKLFVYLVIDSILFRLKISLALTK